MRYAALILIAIFALALVTGCANVKTDGKGTPSPAESEASPAIEDEIAAGMLNDSTSVEIGEMM
ncbi:MAG: hypothetical protein NTV63_03870 [Candidatus Woesearchaeota archaeon]|nr:hypothetical protein [Candidatus Woesearchaeota archaeon]